MVQGNSFPCRAVMGLFGTQRSSLWTSLRRFQPDCLLRHLLPHLPTPTYSIQIAPDGDGGELLLGDTHPVSGWVPMVGPKELPMLQYSPQLVIRVRRCVLWREGGWLVLPVQYARLDFGNTWLSFPSSFFYAFGDLAPFSTGLQLTLDRPLNLYFPAATYHSPGAAATGFGGLAYDPCLPPNMCVLGNELFCGMVLSCDFHSLRVGLGGINVGVVPPPPSTCTSTCTLLFHRLVTACCRLMGIRRTPKREESIHHCL
eukprot:NODE_1963_length_1324_cov_15.104428_g1866_i0.p2 GENE.NODE_1963_length_1324_cov_15.104428_g1866_i0~~NODE_1963_length_1324_cov_15.104428_g1866_i0.p2  ORF type:complete len:257 (-),score=49.29 NODE_1963_length_1324_cov_15.104428_g1866_i0:164-934(-)